MTDRLAKLVPLGLKVGMSETRDRLGFPDPGPNEECLSAPAAALEPGRGNEGDMNETAPEAVHGRGRGHAAHGRASAPQGSAAENRVFPQAMASAPQDAGPSRDWIDDLTDETLDGWRPLTEPLVRPVLELADHVSSFADFEEGLAVLAMAQDTREMALALGRALFVARAASEKMNA
jgi:phage gp29-like protein